jgi:TetR/AcrR family transcriptional regulator
LNWRQNPYKQRARRVEGLEGFGESQVKKVKSLQAVGVVDPLTPKPDMGQPDIAEVAERAELPKSVLRRQQRTEAKSSAILDAALRLFSRFGLHGTTVDQIAEAANVSKTNLFYYFASKEEVYVAVLQRLLEEWLAPFRAIEMDSDPTEAICDYVRRKIEFSRTNPEASRLFCLEIVRGAPLIGPVLRQSLKDLVDAKAAVIRSWSDTGRLAPVDPYHLIFTIWSVTQHYADFADQVEAIVGRQLSDDEFFEQTVRNAQAIILNGVRPR